MFKLVKDVIEDFHTGNGTKKLGILGDIATILGVSLVYIFSSVAVQRFYKINVENLLWVLAFSLMITTIYIVTVWFIFQTRSVADNGPQNGGMIIIFSWLLAISFALGVTSFYVIAIKMIIRDLIPGVYGA